MWKHDSLICIVKEQNSVRELGALVGIKGPLMLYSK